MLLFPLGGLLDEQACHDLILNALHPAGLACPRRRRPATGGPEAPRPPPRPGDGLPLPAVRGRLQPVHRHASHRSALALLHRPADFLLRGFAQGTPAEDLAQELGADRAQLLAWRHRTQALFSERLPPSALPDAVVEADELYQNAGEKGRAHRDPADPPRRRANKRRGHGTFDNGGGGGRVVGHSVRRELEPFVVGKTVVAATVHTDEWGAYGPSAGDGAGSQGGLPRAGPVGSGRATTTGTVCGRSTATRWRASGRVFATSCGLSGA